MNYYRDRNFPMIKVWEVWRSTRDHVEKWKQNEIKKACGFPIFDEDWKWDDFKTED